MADDTQSESLLAFVQRSQVVAGEWALADNVSNIDAVWSCLMSRPEVATSVDRAALRAAINRLAWGLEQRLRPWSSHIDRNHSRCRIPQRRRVDQLLHFVWTQHRVPHLTLYTIAEQMSMTEPYLSRALANVSTHGFPSHLNGFRVMDAALLLPHPQLSIKEIASLSGFSSTGEFDRHSHLWFGMTPRDFRRAVYTTINDQTTERILTFLRHRPQSSPSEIADILEVDFAQAIHIFNTYHEDASPDGYGV